MTASPADEGRPAAEVPVLNVANVLTVLRIVLVPVFLVVFFVAGAQDPWWRVGAFVAFVVAMGTDYIDGYLARRLGLVTDFGKIADPIADKALMSAALLGLWWIGVLPIWIPVIILIREFGITLLRLLIVKRIVLPASKGGKLKTVLQTAGIGFLAMPLFDVLGFWWAYVGWFFLGAALVVTVVTGVDYVRQAIALRRTALASGRTAG